MFDFLKSKKTQEPKPTGGWFTRLKQGLARTRTALGDRLAGLLSRKQIDAELWEELETILITADVGVATTQQILRDITQQVDRQTLRDPQALVAAVRSALIDILTPCSQPLTLTHHPHTLLMVGINGAGKTTSIAKIAHYFKSQGKQVMLAAGDTFRAAAIEQLQAWGDVNQVPVIAQQPGADSASVIYDAMQSAQARHTDLLIADTAGRLHTQSHLMEELAKIKRVMAKLDPSSPHETMLILDASIGQNALAQAKQFHEAIGITSITLTKLDGTAKGGIIFAIANELKLPIRFIGVGEQLDDLKPFSAEEFVSALFTP